MKNCNKIHIKSLCNIYLKSLSNNFTFHFLLCINCIFPKDFGWLSLQLETYIPIYISGFR